MIQKAALQLVFGLLVLAVSARSALAVEVVLNDRTSKATVTMADYPEDKTGNTVVASWDNGPGEVPAGAMMFRRERHDERTLYIAIGSGPIMIVDSGYHTLASGSAVAVFEVSFAKDWDHPLKMVASQDAKVDVAALLARYGTFEHIAGDREARADIDKAIRTQLAQTNTTCKGSLTTDIAWAEFERAHEIALAKQTVGVLEAMANACSDHDFQNAIAKLRKLHIGFQADGKFELTGKSPDISASFSPKSFNPREITKRWIKENL